jgi:outer membrane protein
MKNRMIVFTALLAALAGLLEVRGQSTPPAPGKIGVINIQGAIANTAEGKKVLADLQTKYQPRQKALQTLQQEINALQDQLAKGQATLSEEEQGRLNREVEDKQKQLKRDAEDGSTDFNNDRDEAIRKIGLKMVRVIDDYAQQNGFTLVLDDAQIPVYFAAKDIEITQEIIKRYDAANPVTEAAAPAKPATHPAAPAPKPK